MRESSALKAKCPVADQDPRNSIVVVWDRDFGVTFVLEAAHVCAAVAMIFFAAHATHRN